MSSRPSCVRNGVALLGLLLVMAGCTSSQYDPNTEGPAVGVTQAGPSEAETISQAGPDESNDGTPACSAFLKMDAEERDRLVSEIAVDRDEAKVLQIGLRSNIEMICGEHLDWSLGEVIDSVAGKGYPTVTDTSTLPPCNPKDAWWKKMIDKQHGKCNY